MCLSLLCAAGEVADEVSQVISELVPVRADWIVSFSSCAVQ